MQWTLIAIVLAMSCVARGAEDIPETFPAFEVPGHEGEMKLVREMFWHHYNGNGPQATLWDHWLPEATLWPAVGEETQRDAMARRWAAVLSGRRIDTEGYVSTHQHDRLAHADGWPFPLWNQGKGVGWHFAGTGVHGYDAALVKPDGFVLSDAKGGEITAEGWRLELNPDAMMQTPGIAIEAPMQAPFVRLNWRVLEVYEGKPFLEWATKEHPEFSHERRIYFDVPTQANVETRTMIPVYRHKLWKGVVTALRINFANGKPVAAVIKSIHTAYDSRHNINNSSFISGCCDYFNWTGDVEFLRKNIGRIRAAMNFAMNEFDTRKRKLVYTPWIGHEGTSGVVRSADGKKSIIPGNGIGNNYWDLMPFGGEDFLATLYYFEAVNKLAGLEQAIVDHPAWNVPHGASALEPGDLREHAGQIKAFASQRFWNPKTGRFVSAIDTEGQSHDYGFTFVNLEAIYYGLPSQEQADSILSWISGQRTVEGDTSTGADIYRWRFAPRSTTRRNLDYYIWSWSNPESIPWGYQVQDGGAVLGFSYHDLMARLQARGADDAASRLREITTWFAEVQKAGGYREYYKDPSRGTLQGANVAGGLGLDKEFVESILVPQVMLYGFMNFHPTADGFSINPRLPKDWPELGITRIHWHDAVLSIRATAREVVIHVDRGSATNVRIDVGARSKDVRLASGESVTIER
jgi:hypothetical protein